MVHRRRIGGPQWYTNGTPAVHHLGATGPWRSLREEPQGALENLSESLCVSVFGILPWTFESLSESLQGRFLEDAWESLLEIPWESLEVSTDYRYLE